MNMNLVCRRSAGLALTTLSLAALLALPAKAAEFDLTGGGSVTINGAYFTTVNVQSTGTGVIESFVRIQANGTEEGYNATARPVMPDVNTSPTFTHDLLLSAVPTVVNPTGAAPGTYYEFLLDINQTNANPNLSFNSLQIYTRNTAVTEANDLGDLAGSGLALRYNLDAGANNRIQLNYDLNAGSGSGDLLVYVPIAAFAGAPAGSYVYLYSMFGTETGGTSYASNDGFEEWAVRTASVTSVPDGGATIALLGLSLLGLAAIQRKLKFV